MLCAAVASATLMPSNMLTRNAANELEHTKIRQSDLERIGQDPEKIHRKPATSEAFQKSDGNVSSPSLRF